MKSRALPILVILLSLFVSCEGSFFSDNEGIDDNTLLNPPETFEDTDAPENMTYESLSFNTPWGYKKTDNAERFYPLFVAGYHGEGIGLYSGVSQKYPAFTLEYRRDYSSDGEKLAEWITNAIAAGYRIDVNRIYLTGFSRGGSGSFPLARGMHNEGMYFAAIVRVAGQSQPDLTEEIAERTALWYHIGLGDTSTRVNVARQTLATFRTYNCYTNATETTVEDSVLYHETTFDRTTITFTRNGYQFFKYSEYEGMGHSYAPCYEDDALFTWLFNHSLAYR